MDHTFDTSPDGHGEEAAAPPGHRSGYVAIAGAPNAGKSTILNALVRARLAAVTSKPQTTRRRTLGIVSADAYQIILLDTPGALAAKNPMEEAMVRTIGRALEDADVVLYMIDAAAPRYVEEVERTAERKPTVVALNKVDLVTSREKLLPVIDALRKRAKVVDFIPISALHESNLDLLVHNLVRLLPEGPPFFPKDALTEEPERFFVGELIREQVFERYRQEVPYNTEVLIDDFREREGRRDLIRATVIVETDSQKGILIGKGGQGIKALGTASRNSIENFLGRPVFLELRVKKVAKWRKNPALLRELGFR